MATLKFEQLVAQAATDVRRISASDAAEELKQNGGFVLDVREAAEVAAKPHHRATHIPRGTVEVHIGKHCDDPDTPIYVHCAAGGRATLVAEQLQRMGYRSVTAIAGKIDDVIALLDPPT